MNVIGPTISDVWFRILYDLDKHCYRQDVERGSFAKENYRLQLPWLSLEIYSPLHEIIPVMPEGVPPPNDMDYVREYFIDYLLGGKEPSKNEVYTYASRIGPQLGLAVGMLKETFSTNQASIIVGRAEDLVLEDPACLRAIDLKVVDDQLDLSTFWRSWDIWAGLPTNLGGIALLMEYIAEELGGLKVGTLRAASPGAHIYEYQIPFVEARIGRSLGEVG